MKFLMKCGHVPNATANGKPVCAICIGKTLDAEIIDDNTPDLKGRTAQCRYCNKKRESDLLLPFFSYEPDKKYDSYYCGCFGWD